MSGPGMCSVCGGLVWRDVDHDCPPARLATSPPACSQAGLQAWIGADLPNGPGATRNGA